ncbi:MAG: RHS repeat-associated core domain-containing protein, partial [Pedobacter sp.]
KVEVSRDTINWSKVAAYEYYLHGPLKSSGLGDSIQKLDYVYNLQGWLKAINHPITAKDPGQDNIGEAYTKDVFGMVLHYYTGDYKRTGNFLDAQASITPKSGSHIKDKGKDLYNGNISAWTTYTGFDQAGGSSVDPLMAQGYRYDKLNRLVSSFAETKVTSGFTAWSANSVTLANKFQENLKYDANGNIDTLIRTSGQVSTAMDNMYYRYMNTVTDHYGKTKKVNNKLGYIDDNTDVSGIEDITDQSNGNYVYDAKGRLIRDVANEIDSIIWTPYDKVREVRRTIGSAKAKLQFTYDAMGRRISKKVLRSTTDSTLNLVTYYAYDASGNLMGVYEKEYTSQTEYKYSISEEYVYGSSRVGSYNNGNTVFDSDEETPTYTSTLAKANLRFEITDHLGNVRAVVSGVKKVSGEADIKFLADYYPFGSVMPGRKFLSSNGESRYGFQGMEKDDEMYGDDNSYDFGARIYDARVGRWLSMDDLDFVYASVSPYTFALDNPIIFIDPDGRQIIYANDEKTQAFKAKIETLREQSPKFDALMTQLEMAPYTI